MENVNNLPMSVGYSTEALEKQAEEIAKSKDYVAQWNGENDSVIGKDWTSYNLQDEKVKRELLGKITGETTKLQNVAGEVISVEGIYLENVVLNDMQTGEQKVMPRILLITKDKTYSSCGVTAFNALSKILKYMGLPTKENPLKLKVRYQNNNGKNFYSFQVV